jgi:serine protease AprX
MFKRTLLVIAFLAVAVTPTLAAGRPALERLDEPLRARALAGRGMSRVIIQTTDGSAADGLIQTVGGRAGRRLALVRGQVALVPDAALESLAAGPGVASVRLDRRVTGTMERTGATVGATWVRENLGLDGSGIGVAIIDSGVAAWHDDLGSDRVVHFADFVDFQPTPYDDYGHGTHVSGIIAGNGYDSNGARKGIAPAANLVELKVLDGTGYGYISNVIAALDYAVQQRKKFNIRVINLSVAAGVYESYNTDPLTLAAQRAVQAGIVVVTAAGNLGRSAEGKAQYGGITAPGNAPWVLTVGASSHNGTIDRADDTVAGFSSRGPTYIDYTAKPDIVAPGVGIESLTDRSTVLYATHPATRLWGTVDTVAEPYLSLSGTSMAAPVVTGAIALMFQANPALTPNLVKAILQFTAEHKSTYNDLTQGAGFLNARGAVQLARQLARQASGNDVARATTDEPDPTPWNRHINWGNHRIGGGTIQSNANAWGADVTWGADTTDQGDTVIWGTADEGDNVVWGTIVEQDGRVAWATNVVWGTACGGSDCAGVIWGANCDQQSTGSEECDNVVWGTSTCDGTDEPGECDNVVWGTTADAAEDNVVWGTIVGPLRL